MSKKLILNGPLNFIKLKKNNNEVNIFFDYHMDIHIQHKCDDYESVDLDKYLYKLLKSNKNETIDFLFEIKPTDINIVDINYYNGRYIDSVDKMFRNIYSELNTNKLNVRLHYIDVRDYGYFNIISNKLRTLFSLNTNYKELLYIKEELLYIKNCLLLIQSMIEALKSNGKNTEFETYSKINIDYINIKENIEKSQIKLNTPLNYNDIMDIGLYRILNKIINIYKDNETKKNINTLFMKNYYDVSVNIIKKIDELLIYIDKHYKIFDEIKFKLNITDVKLYNNHTKSIIYGIDLSKLQIVFDYILNNLDDLHLFIINISSVLVDCYCLRRLLNNDIKKSIIYTGGWHSITYIWFLVKYYNYTIEEYNYIKDEKNILKIIKNSDYKDIAEYFFPENFSQCVKINEI